MTANAKRTLTKGDLRKPRCRVAPTWYLQGKNGCNL